MYSNAVVRLLSLRISCTLLGHGGGLGSEVSACHFWSRRSKICGKAGGSQSREGNLGILLEISFEYCC